MDITLERILSLIPKKENGDFVHGAKKKFAQEIGLDSGNVISDWVNGRSCSYKNYVYQIASIYGVSVAWLKGETDEIKKDPAENGEVDGVYSADFNCITHRAPISILAAMYKMNSVALSNAIDIGKDRASFLLTAFGTPTEEECKKAADFFEVPFEDLLSGRVFVQFNPSVQGKIYQLALEAYRRG